MACAGIMAIQERRDKIGLKTKLGEVAVRLKPKANEEW